MDPFVSSVGMLLHETEDEMASSLFLNGGAVDKICCRVLTYKAITLDTFEVLSVSSELPPVTEPITRKPTRPARAAADESDEEVDWLATLSALARPKKRLRQPAPLADAEHDDALSWLEHALSELLDEVEARDAAIIHSMLHEDARADGNDASDVEAAQESGQSDSEEARGAEVLGVSEALGPITCANVLQRMYSCIDVQEVFDALGLHKRPNWEIVRTSDGAVLGRIQSILGRSLKAICRCNHGAAGDCKLIVNTSGKALAVEADLVKWLASGSSCTAAEHAEQSRALRRKYGYLIRE